MIILQVLQVDTMEVIHDETLIDGHVVPLLNDIIVIREEPYRVLQRTVVLEKGSAITHTQAPQIVQLAAKKLDMLEATNAE